MNPSFRYDLKPTVQKGEYGVKTFQGFDALNPERRLTLQWCAYGYNVRVGDGRVTGNVGIREAKVNDSTLPNALSVGSRMVRAAVFKKGDDMILVALMQNKKLYYAHFTDVAFTDSGITFSNHNVTFLQYYYDNKDCMLIIGSDGQMFVFDGLTFEEVADAPHLTTACVFNERVYGTVTEGTNRLYFSDDLDPTNWHVSLTEGGYVDFTDEGGKVTGVIGFKGNLYVFREYAVHKLSAYVDQTDYVMTRVYFGRDKIYYKTAEVVDDKLIFLTEAGFLYTDGYSVRRIFEGVTPLIKDRENAISGSYGNTYVLSCSMTKDEYVVGDEAYVSGNNAVFIYDFLTGAETLFRGTNVLQFLPVLTDDGYKLFTLFNSVYRGFHVGEFDDSGKLFGSSLQKRWRSPYTDLSLNNKDKIVRRCFVTVTSPVTFSVKTDKRSDFHLGGSNYSQVVRVNQKGHKIGLELVSENTFTLIDVTLETDVIGRSTDAIAR